MFNSKAGGSVHKLQIIKHLVISLLVYQKHSKLDVFTNIKGWLIKSSQERREILLKMCLDGVMEKAELGWAERRDRKSQASFLSSS